MPELGSLWYSVGLKDLTDADIKKINEKLKNLGSDLLINPKLAKSVTEILPKGIKLELDPQLKAVSNEALAKAVEGKVMKVEIAPLLTNLRKALKDATKDNPPEIEVGVQSAKLRTIIQNVLNKQGFMLNISTVNDNYSKVVQQKLNGTRYTVKIHADAKEITRSVQASLRQVQSRAFVLQVSRDILYRSIDDALGHKRFTINVAVQHDQARKAVQDALLRAQVIGKDQALAYQRLQTGELKAAQAELARLKAAHMGAADAAKAHATASINLGGALGSNIKIAGELSSAMASLYSVHAAKEFLSQVIEIGGELEHQKIAMDTIFGDKGKTSELFGQIKGLARQSPFGVMELTKSVKALSAYGVQYNEIYDTAKRLADISAATSVDINRLILAFGKTKSRGFLDGLEAKQFAYANIPIYEMVRRKLEELEGQAVTTAQVMERMKKREIGFDIVKDVLWDMTDEGGKFYNMQEALAGSVKTSWKLVRDNIELMFGEIAESSVGGALKSIAEVLQTMTRNWRTMGAAVASVVTVLGLSKIATYGLNRAMEQSVGASTRQILADKKKEAARLRAIRFTSSLTAEEERLIRTSNRLTAEDIKQAYAKGGIAKETVRMLYLTKQLSAEEVKRLATMGMIDAQTAKSIVGTNRLAGAYARLKVSLGGIRQSIGMAMGAMFNWTTAIFAAIGALAMLWQRNSEFNRQAKETSEDIYSKAAEGANNLKKALEDIKPSAGLSEHELTQGIAQMQQAIKDYSPTPIEDINNALVDQKGHVRELTEQYDILQKRVATLADAFDGVANKKVSDALESAIKNTKKNFLSDDIEKQYQDLGSAMEDARSNILAFEKANKTSLHGIIEEAANLSPAYRKAIANMTHDEQKFQELAMNSGKYWNEMSADIQASMKEALNGDFWREGLQSIERLNVWNTAGRWNRASDAAKGAARDLVEGFKTELRNQGADMSQYTEDQLRTIFTSYINGRQLSEDMKRQMKIDVGAELKISLIEEDPIGDAIKDQLKRLAGDENEIKSLSKELGMENAGEILKGALLTIQYDGYDALSPAEKQVVDKLMGDAKTKAMDELSLTNQQMANYLVAHPLTQLINIVYQERNKPSEFQKELWDNKPELKKHLLKPKEMGWYNSWTSGSSGYYETKNKIKQDLESRYNEILAAKNASEEWRKAKQEEFDAMKALAADMGYDDIEVGAKKSNKHPKESQKDEFAEAIKERISLLKKAKSEYESLAKSVGREAASKELADSPIFAGLKANKFLPEQAIPKTLDEYEKTLDELQEKLTAKGLKSKKHRELNVEIEQVKFDIKKAKVDEQLKLALDNVSKEAERQLADWNLYKKLEKATGNKQFAMNFAFGFGVSGQTDYESIVKDKFNAIAKAYKSTLTFDTATPDLLANAPDEVKKEWEKAYNEIQKYRDKEREEVADMVVQYRNTQEEIIALTAEAEEKKRKIRESNLTPVEKQQITAQIDADLNYEVFRKSGEYLKFFNAILSMTGKEAEDVGRKIKEALDEKLKAGRISAKDYCDEMEKIDEQLEKIRQKQKGFGGLGSFAKGGLQQMFKDRFDQAQSDYNAATQNFDTAKQQFDLFSKEGNEAGIQQAQSAMDAASAMKEGASAAMQGAQSVMATIAIIDKIVHGINDTVQGIKGSFDLIADMADSFGVDTSADTGWGADGAFLDAFSQASQHATDAWDSLKSGNVGGVIQGVVGSVTSWFTTFNRWHDAKLQKQIERSQEIVQNIQYAYDAIERRMSSFLGNAKYMHVEQAEADIKRLERLNNKAANNRWTAMGTRKERDKLSKRQQAYEEGGAYGYQRQLMTEQLEELEKQRQAELDKKNTDSSVVADYENQIDEMRVQIQQFAEEVANDLYGIDLKGWASELGDALFEAWKKGEDGAEAFKRKAGEILGDVMNNVLKIGLLEPMMQDVSDYLFGTEEERKKNGGKGGVFGKDFELTPDKLEQLAGKLMAGMEGVDAYNSALDQLEKILNEKYGLSMKGDEESKSGLSAGIQGVTEDTADLLASYINQIRADVAMQTGTYWTRLLDDALPQMNVIAQSQLDTQRQIAENTLRNAVAAEAIQVSTAKLVELNDQMGRSWRRIAERNWGYS